MSSGPVPDDVLPGEPCAGHVAIPGARKCPVFWSPVFGLWLCHDCLGTRTRAELSATDKANAKAALDARLAAGGAAGDK